MRKKVRIKRLVRKNKVQNKTNSTIFTLFLYNNVLFEYVFNLYLKNHFYIGNMVYFLRLAKIICDELKYFSLLRFVFFYG